MDLQKKCMECVHTLRIGDIAQGIRFTLEIFQELQLFMKEILLSCEQQRGLDKKINEEEVLTQFKNLVTYIENKDGVRLADTLEYEIVETIIQWRDI